MSDPDLWWCPRCQTSNAAGDARCVVCDDVRPSPSTAAAVQGAANTAPTESAVLFTSPDAPAAAPVSEACRACGAMLRPGLRFCGTCGTAVASAPTTPAPAPETTAFPASEPPSKRTWIWAASTLVVVVALAVAVVVLTRPKPSDDAEPTRRGERTNTTDASSGDVASGDAPARTVLTAPITTTTTPPVSATPTPSVAALPTPVTRAAVDRSPVGTPPDSLDALDLAQELATALAHDDWDAVRRIEPSKGNLTDAKFYAQYNDLDESTAILVSATPQGTSQALRLGLVAHQNSGQSSIYCVTWIVNTGSRTVIESTSGTKTLLDHAAGTIEPLQQVDTIRSRC